MSTGAPEPSSTGRARWFRQILDVGPHAGAHRVALRAGISVLIPLLVLWSVGHLDWSLYAAFGAFASLYGRTTVGVARAMMQASAATFLIASMLIGVAVSLLPGTPWLVVAVAAVWAAFGAFLSDVCRWHPPGPLFLVFALCAVASVPATPVSFIVAGIVGVVSALLSILIGAIDSVSLNRGVSGVRGSGVRGSGTERVGRRTIDSRRPDAPHALFRVFDLTAARDRPNSTTYLVRYLVAVTVAGSIATISGIGHPYWAMISAVVPLVAVGLSHSIVRGVHRIVGTFAGLLLAFAVLSFEPSGLAAIVVVVALQVLAELFIGRNYGLALVFVTPLALTMIDLASPMDPVTLIRDRAIETVIGTAVALVVIAIVESASRLRLRRHR